MKICPECQREAKDPKRKLCWSCTNYRKRGTSYQEAKEKRAQEKRYGMCRLCLTYRKLRPFGPPEGPKVCEVCWRGYMMSRDTLWQAQLRALEEVCQNSQNPIF